jgi:hypothetical protein
MEDFDYLTDHRGDKFIDGIYWQTEGCGCCADGGTVPPGEERAYIKQYIEQLRSKIAAWENLLATYDE